MVAARRDEVGAICTKRAVPDPALVAVQGGLKREGGGVALGSGGQIVAGLQVVGHRGVEGPDAGRVVGRAGREVAHVGGEEYAGDVSAVGGEFADGDYGRGVVSLNHAPYVDVALGGIVSAAAL